MNEIEMKMMLHNAVERVCKLLGDVSTEEIMGKNRTFRVASARQLVFWYLWYVCKLSFSDIGRTMGKHHATIMYGVRQAEEMIKSGRPYDKRIREAAEELMK